MDNQQTKVGFIGGGNIARSLINGLVESGWKAAQIAVSDPHSEQLDRVQHKHGVAVGSDNTKTADFADVVILAVKPQNMADVCKGLAPVIHGSQKLVLSVAAGIPVERMDAWLGGAIPIVRVMPNTPALLGYGASGAFANPQVSQAQLEIAQAILSAVGLIRWVSTEQEINAVTAVSGSGPAYFFYLMEALEDAAIELGLDAELARDLIAQTAIGSAYMMRDSGKPPGILRDNVTSPGGTTLAAVEVFRGSDTKQVFKKAVLAAHHRAMEMAQEFGND